MKWILITLSIVSVGLLLLQTNGPNPHQDTDAVREDTDHVNILRIATEPIPTLESHTHHPGDSIHNHTHHKLTYAEPMIVPEDMWVTDISFTLHNAPASVLHHAHLMQLNDVNNTCLNGGPEQLMTIGEDVMKDTSVEFSAPHGIFLPQGTPLSIMAMFHNPEPPIGVGGEHKNVYLSFDLTYEPATQTDRSVPLDFYVMHLSDLPCTNPAATFTVPPQSGTYIRRHTSSPSRPHTSQFTLTEAGRIIYAGAHTHGWEGGETINVYKNGELLEAYETHPSSDNPLIWETDHGYRDIPLEAGDTIEIEAIYNNELNTPITGAMGIYGFYFAPEPDSTPN